MNLHERVKLAIQNGEHVSHADRNKANVEAIREAKAILKAELGINEVAEFIFKELPARGVLKALSVLIGRAETMADLKTAFDHAQVFKSVHDCNPVADTTRITLDLHSLIDDIEIFIDLAMSIESDNGAFFSQSEAELVLKLSRDMDRLQDDLNRFVLSRTVKDDQPKEIKE